MYCCRYQLLEKSASSQGPGLYRKLKDGAGKYGETYPGVVAESRKAHGRFPLPDQPVLMDEKPDRSGEPDKVRMVIRQAVAKQDEGDHNNDMPDPNHEAIHRAK